MARARAAEDPLYHGTEERDPAFGAVHGYPQLGMELNGAKWES